MNEIKEFIKKIEEKNAEMTDFNSKAIANFRYSSSARLEYIPSENTPELLELKIYGVKRIMASKIFGDLSSDLIKLRDKVVGAATPGHPLTSEIHNSFNDLIWRTEA